MKTLHFTTVSFRRALSQKNAIHVADGRYFQGVSERKLKMYMRVVSCTAPAPALLLRIACVAV